MPTRKASPELKSFGTEVTRLREEAGLTRTELAALVTVSRSYVSQVESGNTRCRQDFAARLDKGLGTGTALFDAWNDLVRSTGYPRYFTDFSAAEKSAVMLRAYETTYIYGLLQIESYARVLLTTDEAVQGRMRRQNILARDHPPMICVVLDESVLYRQVGSSEVMHEQLGHLLSIFGRENIALQIAPVAYYRGVRASFTIATQPDRTEVLYLENAARGETNTDAEDLTQVSETFVRLQARALSVDDSRALIERTMVERWT
ncbi:helix-turn-helix transcriptional regulator [Actinomadura viridis]|uniref:Transcriptional regulator with XRE-family HTH domain n=1 Tax=Actinomadura viridis TaxID=58110 RepID=A0A931DJ81_9ACTN|nr:helix-turn-helix transcriptional regulator [Actinomadura viridis]MBG6091015.1 transcriptional regulator with XRE-family HTH domain [Actinomadura viridis]